MCVSSQGCTPESYLDLHQFLPPEYQGLGGRSVATGIDAEGNIIGYALDRTANDRRAVMWRPVPEPGTLLILSAGLGWILARRRKFLSRKGRNRSG